MKNILLAALVGAVFATPFLSYSQQPAWCGSVEALNARFRHNAQLQQQFEEYLEELKQNPTGSSRAVTEVIFIPVVFHIVHNGDAIGSGENITDAQAISQIDALNTAYNFQDPDMGTVPSAFQSLVANVQVKFCLAKFDANGDPTTGVIRHEYTSNVTWDDYDDIDNVLKPATIWDPATYLNIWSVRMGGTLTADGVLAYSSIPFGTIDDKDGVVSRYTNIGTTANVAAAYRKGKTIVHEVGHWLGLLHVWGFDANCNDFGDFIDDTPDQADLNFGCPAFPHVSCNNGPNGDMFMNYMDYTDQNCSSMFTLGQSERMHSVLDGIRSSIKSATSSCYVNLDANVVNILFPSDTICQLNFKPIVTLKNEGTTTITSGKFFFQLDGGTVQILDWSGFLGIQQQTQILLPVQNVSAGVHTLDVTFGNVNGQPADNFPANDNKSVSFYAYYAGEASAIPFTEDFETLFPQLAWSVYNPNNDNTWVWNITTGAYGTSTACASINNLSYTSNPNKKKDALVTDVYDLSTAAYPQLKFDIAYARYSATRSDSLNVYYSLDCGNVWTKIWNANGAQLSTAPDQTTLFTPTATQWQTFSIPLLSLTGLTRVSFKFENVTGWGNRLYLDNINVENNQALAVNETPRENVKVFPNPAGKFAAVRLPARHSFHTFELFNSLGEKLFETFITDDGVIFPVENLPAGLYVINLRSNSSSQTEKLLISR